MLLMACPARWNCFVSIGLVQQVPRKLDISGVRSEMGDPRHAQRSPEVSLACHANIQAHFSRERIPKHMTGLGQGNGFAASSDHLVE